MKRLRKLWPFAREKAPTPGVQDLTALWQRTHGHLKPLEEHLPMPPDSLSTCSFCKQPGAIALSVQVGTDGRETLTDAVVHYCPACQRYFFDPAVQANREVASQPISKINARCWFAMPTFLNIEPTTCCNFRCWYCIGRTMPQVNMKLDDYRRIFDHFPALQTIALVGEGEPLLHPDFFLMADIARDRGVRVMLTSNGSRFSDDVIRNLCESAVTYLSVSIDSVDPATFADSRPPGNLDEIWRGVERLRSYRDRHGYRYPVIGLKGTLFAHTVDQLPAIIEEGWRRGMEVYEGFQPLNPMVTYLPCYPEDKKALLASVGDVAAKIAGYSRAAEGKLESISQFCARERIEFDKSGRPNGLRPGCDEQWIYALASGDITPCCMIKEPVSPRWNLFQHPLPEILADPLYESTRFNLFNGIFPPGCAGCYKVGCR
ncbi:MAG: radical SAM protein [Desulfuromonadaceae bacterium]|nr:radical SAM protein [Desulfuromonadaceae bacterium]